MKRYEYTMFTVMKDTSYEKTIASLNERGKNGWELVQMFDNGMCYVCSMKREIHDTVEGQPNVQMLCD